MQAFTNKNKKPKVILFLKSINYCTKKKKKIYFYILKITFTTLIAFEMSRIVVFLIFGALNTKYLAFRIPDASILILG